MNTPNEERNYLTPDRRTVHFRSMWEILASEGMADELDGREYHRVLAAWKEAGRPRAIGEFIVKEANRPA